MCPRAHVCPASVVDVIHSAESFHVAKATKQPTLGTGRFSQFLLRPALIVDLCTNLAQANARSAATSPVTGCARRASCWTPSIAARLASRSATSPPRMSPSLAQRWCPSREYSPRRRRVSMAVPRAPERHQLHQPHPSRRRGSRRAPHSIQMFTFVETLRKLCTTQAGTLTPANVKQTSLLCTHSLIAVQVCNEHGDVITGCLSAEPPCPRDPSQLLGGLQRRPAIGNDANSLLGCDHVPNLPTLSESPHTHAVGHH